MFQVSSLKTVKSLESASSFFCTFLWQKGIPNHGEVYPKKVEKSTVTHADQSVCQRGDAIKYQGVQYIYVICC